MPPGSVVELRVDRLEGGGRGVARHEGRVWFVEGALPGDRVSAVVLRDRGRFVEARASDRIEPSELRRPSPCPYQDRCGGCPWMGLTEDTQREWKRRLVADALERIGGGVGCAVEPVRPTLALGYRDRIELVVGVDASGPVVGFHPQGSSLALDVDRCLLQTDLANEVLAELRVALLEPPWDDLDPVRLGTSRPRVVLRGSRADGGMALVLRVEGPGEFPREAQVVRRLAGRADVRGIVRLNAPHARRGGARGTLLAGRPWLEERLAGFAVRLPAGVFTQVHREGVDLLVREVAAEADEVRGARVLDLYGGIGLYGMTLARRGARALVCEADPSAVRCGSETAAAHGLGAAVRFTRAEVGRWLKQAAPARADLVVANPPRSGLGRGVAGAIVQRRPRRILLVSCDPATLARDVRSLLAAGQDAGFDRGLDAGRYRVVRVLPFDLFPQTPHVETLVRLDATGGG